ncbi:MAG: NUDIX hydrolase [Candidatus Promineifilaceae bacterium]
MGKSDQGIRVSESKYRAIPRVLVFIRHGSDVLLLKGADDKRIWANKFNGVGGHVERDEDILTAAKRETLEETGLIPTKLILKAVVNIEAGDPLLGIIIFVFTGWSDKRQTTRSEEGELFWVPVDEIGSFDLVEDLYWLLPRIFGEEQQTYPLYLQYHYDENDDLVILDHHR